MFKSYYLAKVLHKLNIPSFNHCEIHRTSCVSSGCALARVTMGKYSYTGDYTHITDAFIGSFCSIGMNCSIGGGIHPMDTISTSPVFLKGKNIMRVNFASFPYSPSETVFIGNDVWIGNGVFIKAGITIGDGSVVGAHSVVTHDIEPYSVVAGVPARIIRKRFDDDTIQKLIDLKWWSWPESKLKEYARYFSNPKELFRVLDGGIT